MYIQQLARIKAVFDELTSSPYFDDIGKGARAIVAKTKFIEQYPKNTDKIASLAMRILELSSDETAVSLNRLALAELCEQSFLAWLTALNDSNCDTLMRAELFNSQAKYQLQKAADHYYQYITANNYSDINILSDYLRITFILMLCHCVSRQETKIVHVLRHASTVIVRFTDENPDATEALVFELCNKQETLQPLQLPQIYIVAIRNLIGCVSPKLQFSAPDENTLLFNTRAPYDNSPAGKYALDQVGQRKGQPKLKYL